MGKSLRIVQVIPRIITKSSGVSYSIPALCNALHEKDADVHLHLLRPTILDKNVPYSVHTYPVLPLPLAFRFGLSPLMKNGLRAAATSADILHNHSLWMLPNIYPGHAVANTGCKVVVSPRGTLSGWVLKRSRIKKKIALMLGQKKVLEHADMYHATGENELKEIRTLGLKAPVIVVPNGVDVPALTHKKACNRRRLVFFSRIHPKKGIDILIHAWARLENEFVDWDLTIAGPLESEYAKDMQKLAQEVHCTRVQFCGEISKREAFENTNLFVLPTHSENFGLVVAESLSFGVPVIVTKGAPWHGVETHGCGWWIDIGLTPLMKCLREAMGCTEERLKGMGRRGYTWVQNEFSWTKVAEKMFTGYIWLLHGGAMPDWVYR
jgi:glycosyltransferase involved in cell wall biosynthesis